MSMGMNISAGTIMAYMVWTCPASAAPSTWQAGSTLRLCLRRCGGRAGFHRRSGGNGRTRVDHAHHGQTARRGAGGFTGRHEF